MKNLIFLFALILFAASVTAQESATYDSYLNYSQYKNDWPGVGKVNTVNTLTTTDTTWTFTVFKDASKPLKYDAFLRLDSIGGTKNNVTIKLQAKKFIDSPTWTDLKTVYWTSGTDTTKTITESTTAGQYSVYRLWAQGADNTFIARFLYYAIKFWE